MKQSELPELMLSETVVNQSLVISLAFTLLCFGISGISYWHFMRGNKQKYLQIKIQKSFPSTLTLINEVIQSLVSMLIFSVSVYLGVILYHSKHTLIYGDVQAYGMLYTCLSFFIYMLAYDLYFYVVHRLLHLPMFRKAHGLHHHSVNPTPFSSFSLHPIEAALVALGFPLLLIILPMHPIVLGLNILHFIFVNIMGHSGYEFHPMWFKKTWLGRITNYPTFHNEHHQFGTSNYGLFTVVWDQLLGTMNENSDEHFENLKSNQQNIKA